jgi:selenocysteine lyase/cysteine desulfurase
VGWLSVKNSWNFFDYQLDLLEDACRFEIATPNFLGIKGLRVSTDLLLEAGIPIIEDHLLKLGEKLISGLSESGFTYIGGSNRENQSGIYSFKTTNEKMLVSFLREAHVHLSLREDVVRFAPHFYNSETEIDEVINLCRNFTKK